MRNSRTVFKKPFFSICTRALEGASKEQGLDKLKAQLEKIVPDISDQYSFLKIDSTYLRTKARNLHAFQLSLVNTIIEEFNNPTIVDIGDSSGTHVQYISGLYSHRKKIQSVSVNMDEKAIARIKVKGLRVVKSHAEDLKKYNIHTDIFLCFEVLEHVTDPCRFLYRLSRETDAKYVVITVPYVNRSRVGLHHLRAGRNEQVHAENTHIFELNPGDWKLLIRHAGWDVVDEKVYFQYPRRSFLRITKPLWRKFDFEGFYGVTLKKDDTWSSKYSDWRK